MATRGEDIAPAYRVRVSERARRVRLVMTADRGLEVVIPRRFDRRKIPALLEAKRDWVDRAFGRIEAQRRELEENPPRLPQAIALPAAGERWRVQYRPRQLGAWGAVGTSGLPGADGARAREHPGGLLVVTGYVEDPAVCQEALRRWLRRKARAVLIPRLAELASLHGLGYQRASIRQQRSRWGSCSQRGAISLNANLLFLEAPLVDYVLLHELCHTVEMNHSARFWTLLGYHDPGCKTHRRTLRLARATLPAWVEREVGEPALEPAL